MAERRNQTLKRLLQVLNILTLEAVTARDLAKRTGLRLRTVYRYIHATEEVFTVSKVKRTNFGTAYKIGPAIPGKQKGESNAAV
jgi:predicted DNA-binding transcriptional regulator YafY